MAILTLNVPPEVYQRLQQEAGRTGQAVEDLATAWLGERAHREPRDDFPSASSPEDRDKARAVLREAGLSTELGPELKRRARQSTTSLEEVEAAFARAGGQSLSEIAIEMRGPKT